MTQKNWTTIMSIAAAAVLAVVQAMQHVTITDNHEMTHERIDALDAEVVPRKEVEATYMNGAEIIALQIKHSDEIKELHDYGEVIENRLLILERQMDSVYEEL